MNEIEKLEKEFQDEVQSLEWEKMEISIQNTQTTEEIKNDVEVTEFPETGIEELINPKKEKEVVLEIKPSIKEEVKKVPLVELKRECYESVVRVVNALKYSSEMEKEEFLDEINILVEPIVKEEIDASEIQDKPIEEELPNIQIGVLDEKKVEENIKQEIQKKQPKQIPMKAIYIWVFFIGVILFVIFVKILN